MFLSAFAANAASNITLGQASLYALLGYAIVFFGLILLMAVVVIIGKSFMASARKKVQEEQPPVPVKAPEPVPAPGSAGQLKLHGVEPKTAAMLMAIVADKLGKPVNELRFLSIKEVEK